MSRPLRIEFPGATYHVTVRGDRLEAIFVDDTDRGGLLDVLAQGLQTFDAVALAYCLMGNHFHFVLYTRQANLSRLMRHVNGLYSAGPAARGRGCGSAAHPASSVGHRTGHRRQQVVEAIRLPSRGRPRRRHAAQRCGARIAKRASR